MRRSSPADFSERRGGTTNPAHPRAGAPGGVSGNAVRAGRDLPGGVAIWAARHIADLPLIEFREGPIEALAPYRQPVLARDFVRYVGEPVAAIFAEDPYVAEDAAELV